MVVENKFTNNITYCNAILLNTFRNIIIKRILRLSAKLYVSLLKAVYTLKTKESVSLHMLQWDRLRGTDEQEHPLSYSTIIALITS